MIGRELEELEKLIKENRIGKTYIWFPRGVIRRADDIRNTLFFIDNSTLRTNLAYHMMVIDVYRWILNRFDIEFTAKEMILKQAISIRANMIDAIAVYVAKKVSKKPTKPEWADAVINETEKLIPDKNERNRIKGMLKRYLHGHIGLKKALKILIKNEIIDSTLEEKLLEVWNIRNKEHLLNLREKEFQKYNVNMYNRYVRTWNEFIGALQKAHKEGKI